MTSRRTLEPGDYVTTRSTADELVRVTDLVKRYKLGGTSIDVLRGVDFTLRKAEKISIVGKSGVGKSTLMHVLGTLDRPTSGKVYVKNFDVFSLRPRQLARYRNETVGFVFQFHYLLPDFSALENVMMPLRIAKADPDEASERAASVLKQVGLRDRILHKPGELSGGEQQRVAIARAVVMRPAVVLADEPTGNLDSQTSEGIHELLQDLNEMYQTAVMVVTHDNNLARRMDRRLILEDGKLWDAETASETQV